MDDEQLILRSPRLQLRPCQPEDIDRLLNHWQQPLVRRFLFDDQVPDRNTVEGFVATSAATFAQKGYGLWLLNEREATESATVARGSKTASTDRFCGVCGLWDELIGEPELLYSIEPDCWGQGLATEAARCVLTYAFETLRLPQVKAGCDVSDDTPDRSNLASLRVIEKLGMTLETDLKFQNAVSYFVLMAEAHRP